MDYFYVPPNQRPQECQKLDENYMNCLVQKAMKDRVFTNKCVLDSVLWFHLECPSWAEKYDDPAQFRAKVRDFFAWQNREANIVLTRTDEQKAAQYTTSPDDVRAGATKQVRMFRDEFQALDPTRVPVEGADGWKDETHESWFDGNDDGLDPLERSMP